MKSEFNEVAYDLVWDVDHFAELKLDWDTDIYFEKYDEYAGYELFETEPFLHPTPLIYTGDLETVRYIDYPYPDNYWNVMSRRMLDTLLSVGDFPHRAIPVAIVDAQINPEHWYDANGNLRDEITLKNYVAIQLIEHLDIFDYEQSSYKIGEEEPDRFEDISKFVFKIPVNGLPPIFRIKERDLYLFISSEARSALKEAKITGTRYISLQGASQTRPSEVDTKIILSAEVIADSR